MFRTAAVAVCLVSLSLPAFAQNPGYFIPPAGGGEAGAARHRPRDRSPGRLHRRRVRVPCLWCPPPSRILARTSRSRRRSRCSCRPCRDLPALARTSGPPAAVIGVLGIPDIMRASAAAQQIEKTIGERREKLNEDAQKEQAAWRDLQQALANQRAGLSADQIRAKERELQDRITNAQKTFRDRNRIIQESGQFGLAQIERMLIAVIRQVAESRGMNLVLHRAQVALNVNEFDITEQVVEQLNKALPTVSLPPDGVSPATFAPVQPAAQAPAAPAATPAASPAGTPAPTPTAPTAPPRR